MSILVLLVPSDADGGGGDGDDDDGGVPTTLPAWQVPRGYHGQGSNIPFGESLTLINVYKNRPKMNTFDILEFYSHRGLLLQSICCIRPGTHKHVCIYIHQSEGFPERDI